MGADLQDDIRFRQIVPDDVRSILGIETLCFSTPWSETSFLSEIRSPNSLTVLAESAGKAIGYVIVKLVADESHLHDLAVHPDWRRRGVARRLMQKALEEVRGSDKRFFFLEVRVSNRPAISLYESLGFCVYASRRAYYDNPSEDAVLMRLDFDGLHASI